MDFFRKQTAARIAQQQLDEAERLALEHKAAAEHHEALAAMYAARIARLTQGRDPRTEA